MRTYLADYRNSVFLEHEIQMLCSAFEEAWRVVEANPDTYVPVDSPDLLRHMLAEQIVYAARNGICSHSGLRDAGFHRIGADSPTM